MTTVCNGHLPSEGPNGEPGFFERVELIDGALIFAAPQQRFHQHLSRGLTERLDAQAPGHLAAIHRMGSRTRPCPDVVIIDAATDMTRTYYEAHEVHLVIEVVSPESVERDRKLKPARYAEAGIPHFWRVEESDGRPVVYVYERDPATGAYTPTGIHHGHLAVQVPFPIEVDLDQLVK
ncbi:Uma2 family endonuclease [Microbispora sp. CA-135349]|uniref:Uma2 family endonuclease n=1 Tax=Microbispora sp. CA-135349 TaxID=3239953 RepID=UPI003D8F74C4